MFSIEDVHLHCFQSQSKNPSYPTYCENVQLILKPEPKNPIKLCHLVETHIRHRPFVLIVNSM